ncbi:oligosaccharide repeat unit polymerase [Empedobacter falsenii]
MEQTHSFNNKKSLKINLTYKELGIFLLLFFLNLKFLSITVFENRSLIADLFVYFLLIITFNYSNWTYKSLFTTSIIIGIYTLINFSSYKLNILMPLLIMQSVSSIRLKKYLLFNFIITSTTLILMFIFYGEGNNVGGYSYMIDRTTRMTFGFNHPNAATLYYYCIIINGLILMYYSKYRKYIPWFLLIVAPLWIYIYIKTVSRSFLLSLIMLYLSFAYYYSGLLINKKNILKISKYPFIFLVLIFTIITVYFSINREKYLFLDRVFSKRLTYYDHFFDKINLKDFFFGSTSYDDLIIDSSYVHLLFEGGIFFFIGFCLFYIMATINMTAKKALIPICIVISFLSYGLMETNLLYNMLIGTNILWVLLYYYYKNGKMEL